MRIPEWKRAVLSLLGLVAGLGALSASFADPGSPRAFAIQNERVEAAGGVALTVDTVFASRCPCPELPDSHPDNFRNAAVGQTRSMALRVTNRGTAATDIFTVVYRWPEGWELTDPAWTPKGDRTATRTFTNSPIDPQGEFTTSIELHVPAHAPTGYTGDAAGVEWAGSPPASPAAGVPRIWVGPGPDGRWIWWEVARVNSAGALVPTDVSVSVTLAGRSLDEGFDAAPLGTHALVATPTAPYTVESITCGPLGIAGPLPFSDGSAYADGRLHVATDTMCLITVRSGPAATSTTIASPPPGAPTTTTVPVDRERVDRERVNRERVDRERAERARAADAAGTTQSPGADATPDELTDDEVVTTAADEDSQEEHGPDEDSPEEDAPEENGIDEQALIPATGNWALPPDIPETATAAIRREWAQRSRARAPRARYETEPVIERRSIPVGSLKKKPAPASGLRIRAIVLAGMAAVAASATLGYAVLTSPRRRARHQRPDAEFR